MYLIGVTTPIKYTVEFCTVVRYAKLAFVVCLS